MGSFPEFPKKSVFSWIFTQLPALRPENQDMINFHILAWILLIVHGSFSYLSTLANYLKFPFIHIAGCEPLDEART